MKLYEYAWFKTNNLERDISKNVLPNTNQKMEKLKRNIYKTFSAAYFCSFENKEGRENMFSINTGTGCSCFDTGYFNKNHKRLFLCFEQNISEQKFHIVGIRPEGDTWFKEKMVTIPEKIKSSFLLNKNQLANKNYQGTFLSYDSEEHLRERINDGRVPEFIRDLGEDEVIDYIYDAMMKADKRFTNNEEFYDNTLYVQSMNNKVKNNVAYFIPVEFPLAAGKKYTMALVGRRFVEQNLKDSRKKEIYLDVHTIYRLEDALDYIAFIKEPKLKEFQKDVLLENKRIEKNYKELEIDRLKNETDGNINDGED